ncbi:signal peptidase I [Rothia sp. CCM 9418]|uniref:signal peptidase I n=1 Tax=unclassified Rothia (in: high G+C Gram-positive bacteria) TaxID=2689056 RepID=UPI003ACA9C46
MLRSQPTNRRPIRYGWRRLFAVIFSLALLCVILIRSFLVDVFYIPSASMEPTLNTGDRILVSRLDTQAQRGDLVVFDGTGSFDPYRSTNPWLHDPLGTLEQWVGLKSSQTIYVKRVIGVAGDRITCCSDTGTLLLNGQELEEPYLFPGDDPSTVNFDVIVPPGRIWVMGDHRSVSEDSRALLAAPGGGMIREEKIIGKPIYRILPLQHFGALEHIATH